MVAGRGQAQRWRDASATPRSIRTATRPGQTQFGPAQSRSFTPFSAAVGGIYKLAPSWQLSANLAYTERAPTFYELYANGLHVATGAYEVGNPDLGIEKGSNLDVAVQWKDGANRFKVGAFGSDFSNYIALLATGQQVDTDEGPVPGLPVHGCAGTDVRHGAGRQLAAARQGPDVSTWTASST